MDGDRRLQELASALRGGSFVTPRHPAKNLFVEPRRPETDAHILNAAARIRVKIWELSPNFHCAMVGTCLNGTEARRLLSKLGIAGGDTLSEHELHAKTVALARYPEKGGRALQKTLDRLHKTAIARFAAARDEAALLALWDDAVLRADIAGGFWAVLTHPAATTAVMQKAFGEVHMLSHLMGAANRADIRRLRQLEAEKAALEGKLARQQAHLRHTVLDRDNKLRAMGDMLARKLDSETRWGGDDAALNDLVAEMKKRLEAELAARQRAEQRQEKLGQEIAAERERRSLAERDAALLAAELETAEARLAEADPAEDGPGRNAVGLEGRIFLYVGGRPSQVPHLRRLATRCAAEFLYHDGGEDRGDRLPSLIARSDAVLFPVDCVSHDAAIGLKRLCKRMAKPYMPLRSASLSAFLVALSRFSDRNIGNGVHETQRAQPAQG